MFDQVMGRIAGRFGRIEPRAEACVGVPRGEVTEAELIAHARERLSGFKTPKRVLFADALPRNASGKILKRELRDRFADG